MPTYVYRCTECGREFDIRHAVDAEPSYPPYHMAEAGDEAHKGEFVRVFTPPNLSGLPTRGPQNEETER
jgi:predicted nucleic acid-binding Zn ribbon protein